MRIARRCVAIAIGWTALSWSEPAVVYAAGPSGPPAAAACNPQGLPWVELVLDKDSPALAGLRERLRGELLPRHIEVCTGPSGSEGAGAGAGRQAPIASVEVTPGGVANVELVVLVRDAVTNKRVARDLDLSKIPADGRALTVALAADELLRASWAELALAHAPPPQAPVPDAVTDTVAASLVPMRAAPKLAIGALFAADRYGGNQTHLGTDLDAAFFFGERWSARARLGLRWGVPVRAPDGQVTASAMLAMIGTGFALTPPASRYGVDLRGDVGLLRVAFAADPEEHARSRTGYGIAVLAHGGAEAWVSVGGAARFVAGATIGRVLRAVKATDEGAEVTGVSGLTFGASLGLVGVFR